MVLPAGEESLRVLFSPLVQQSRFDGGLDPLISCKPLLGDEECARSHCDYHYSPPDRHNSPIVQRTPDFNSPDTLMSPD